MRKLILTLIILGIFMNAGWAATYEGIIVEVLDGGQTLKMTQVDSLTKDKKTLFVSVDEHTQILGTEPSEALKPGDSISVNGVETEFDHLSAKSITVASKK